MQTITQSVFSECSNPNCIYSRKQTAIRMRYTEKMYHLATGKTNLNIMFYGSYKLKQEMEIILCLANRLVGETTSATESIKRDRISEIHLVDIAYSKKNFDKMFEHFLHWLRTNEIDARVYVHRDPAGLIGNNCMQQRIDLIGGIDFDYDITSHIAHRFQLKEIASRCLKHDGAMCISQHYEDMVDLSIYQFNDQGIITMTETDDFIKPEFYYKYKSMDLAKNYICPVSKTGFVASLCFMTKHPLASLFGCTFFLSVATINKFFLPNYNFRRNIYNLADIMLR